MREKIEFESFVMRTHGIQSIRFLRKDTLVLKRASEIVASATVKPTGKGHRLVMDAASNKWAALLRFHIARQYGCAVSMYDPNANVQNSCSRDRCFRYLCEAFPKEWQRFQGGGGETRSDGAGSGPSVGVATTPSTIGPIIVNRNDGGRGGGGGAVSGGGDCFLGHIRQFAEQLDALVQKDSHTKK